MEKSKVIALLQASFSQPNSFESLVRISDASKLISSSLVLSQTAPLAADNEVLKLLIYSIPINPNNTMFLLSTIFVKCQKNKQLIDNSWKVFEFLAKIEDQEQTLSLHKKFLEQEVNSIIKTVKISSIQEQYLLKRIIQLKTSVLKLLPELFELIHQNFPETLKDKVFVLKLLKSNTKTESIIQLSQKLIEKITLKYCPELQDVERHYLINKTKKYTVKKMQSQTKYAVQKSILEESVALNSPDIYSLLKSQTRLETFFTYILCPKAIAVDENLWKQLDPDQDKPSYVVRKQFSVRLLSSKESLKKIQTHVSDFLTMFFNLVQRYFKQTDLKTVINILKNLWQSNPISVSVIIMQTGFLEKIFYSMQQQSVFEFVSAFTTLKYPWIKDYKHLFYQYFRISGFFKMLFSNMSTRRSQYLDPIKTKQFNDIEVKLESRAIQLKINKQSNRQILDLYLSDLEVVQTPYDYQLQTQKPFSYSIFAQGRKIRPSCLQSTLSSKKKTSLRKSTLSRESTQIKKQIPTNNSSNNLPPFAVKQYKGYFSTAPVLNFNTIQITDVDTSNQNWCYINCKLYYGVLYQLIEGRQSQLLNFAVPNESQLQEMFSIMRKYKNLALNSSFSNSAVQISKILILLLRDQNLTVKSQFVSQLCQKNINVIYPIINILFNKQKNKTLIQKLTVIKTLDLQILQIVELFLLMIKNILPNKRQQALADLDENIWQILTLWFFDCMLNNTYQVLLYDIFSELFQHGSEILLLNILFKNNLVGALYNAYSDVVKNGVLITQWHIHSFFIHLCKLYALIRDAKDLRTQFKQIQVALPKMLSWSLLQGKIKETFGGKDIMNSGDTALWPF